MNNVITITDEHRKQHQFLKTNYKDIKLIELIDHALSNFYAIRSIGGKVQPPEYNPILLYGIGSSFDPYIMTSGQARNINPEKDMPWQPWPAGPVLKRITRFVVTQVIPARVLLKYQIKLNNKFLDYFEKWDAFSNFFTYTIEDLTDNSIIITIIDNYDNCKKTL